MIDAISIFTKGGVVLWSYYYIKLKSSPIDRLIKTILLEDRIGQQVATFDSVSVQWRLVNSLDLVFVVVYRGLQPIAHIDSLLALVTTEFLSFVGNPRIPAAFLSMDAKQHEGFTGRFFKVLDQCERQQLELQKAQMSSQLPTAVRGGKNSSVQRLRQAGGTHSRSSSGGDSGSAVGDGGEGDDETPQGNLGQGKLGQGKLGQGKLGQGKLGQGKKVNRRGGPDNSGSDAAGTGDTSTKNSKSKKEATKWHSQKVTKKAMEALDFSSKQQEGGGADAAATYGADKEFSDSESENDDVSSDSAEETGESTPVGAKGVGGWAKGIFSDLSSSIKNFTGNAEMTAEDLDSTLAKFRLGLLEKNVANDIANQLVDSVKATLQGAKTARWTSVTNTVKEELTQVVQRILTPKKSVDVLKAAMDAKARGDVYSICFLGVNGVGKSTNLAKVCYFLKQKGQLNVIIAACDTFRAGAVEQLRTHAKCIGAHLFEQGYGKDPSLIAKQALQYARANGYDVLLIDTAGRMQDNEPLMRALAKLVAINLPDLILFVGEALVGNDAIDQLVKFDQCLHDYAPPSSTRASERRTIDGVLLTKFDTVDDKVGAALSMVYQTGQPIVFVGTGQKYTHLRKLNVNTVVKAVLG